MLDYENHRYEIAMSVTFLGALVSSANRSSQNGPMSQKNAAVIIITFYLLKKKKTMVIRRSFMKYPNQQRTM